MNITRLCKKVGMTRQNYYKTRGQREVQAIDEAFIARAVKEERHLQPRIGTRKLKVVLAPDFDEAGIAIGRDRLFDVLRNHDLLVPKLKRFAKTTNSRHSLPVFVNLIKHTKPTAPNEIWVADITYIRTRDDFVYLALIMDLYSRKIIGYHCGDSLEAKGAIQALKMALKALPQGSHPIHHSDRGCQYCSHAYFEELQKRKIKVSMTEEMHCYENAHAERLNGILKQEYGLGMTFNGKEHACQTVDQAVRLYNTRRPHNALKLKTPEQVHRNVA